MAQEVLRAQPTGAPHTHARKRHREPSRSEAPGRAPESHPFSRHRGGGDNRGPNLDASDLEGISCKKVQSNSSSKGGGDSGNSGMRLSAIRCNRAARSTRAVKSKAEKLISPSGICLVKDSDTQTRAHSHTHWHTHSHTHVCVHPRAYTDAYTHAYAPATMQAHAYTRLNIHWRMPHACTGHLHHPHAYGTIIFLLEAHSLLCYHIFMSFRPRPTCLRSNRSLGSFGLFVADSSHNEYSATGAQILAAASARPHASETAERDRERQHAAQRSTADRINT